MHSCPWGCTYNLPPPKLSLQKFISRPRGVHLHPLHSLATPVFWRNSLNSKRSNCCPQLKLTVHIFIVFVVAFLYTCTYGPVSVGVMPQVTSSILDVGCLHAVRTSMNGGIASYGALGHVPPSTFNNFIFSSLWSKSDSQLSKYCIICEIRWCRCQ